MGGWEPGRGPKTARGRKKRRPRRSYLRASQADVAWEGDQYKQVKRTRMTGDKRTWGWKRWCQEWKKKVLELGKSAEQRCEYSPSGGASSEGDRGPIGGGWGVAHPPPEQPNPQDCHRQPGDRKCRSSAGVLDRKRKLTTPGWGWQWVVAGGGRVR